MNCGILSFPLAAGLAALFASPSVHAASQAWDGGSTTDGNWSNPANWLGDNPPPGSTSASNSPDVATFNAPIANGWGTSTTPIVIDSPTQNIGGITFINKSTTGDYVIGTTGGNALRLSNGGSISLTFDPAIPSIYVNTETVNAPLILLGTTCGFSNSSNNAILKIGGNVSGSTGNTTLTLVGSSFQNGNYITGNISNGTATSLAVALQGSTTWVLSGANTYTGGTTLNGGNNGTLRGEVVGTSLTPTSPFGTGTIQMNGGTLTIRASGTLDSTAETITLGNNVAVTANATIDMSPPTGAGSQNKIIAMGNLKTAARTLQVTQANGYALSFSSVTLTGGPTFNPSNQLILGPVGEEEDSRNLTKTGTGILTLMSANTYSGTTTVSGGTLDLRNNLALQNSTLVTTGAGTVVLGPGVTTPTIGGLSGATGDLASVISSGYNNVTALTLNTGVNLYFGTPVTRSYGGIIANGSGNTTLIKTGAGTQVLTGQNTYTGATAIRAGTLRINGIQTAATGAITVGGATATGTPTLAGTGSLGGSVTLATASGGAAGTLAPGSAGTGNLILSATNLTFETGSTASFEVDADTLNRDRVTGIAALTYGGRLRITATSGTLTAGETWDLFDFTSQSGTFENHSSFGTDGAADPDLPDLGANLTWQFNYATGTLSVAGVGNYTSWANDPGKGNIPGEPASGDFENDGISNLMEYALGLNPRVSSQPAGTFTGNTITYAKGLDAIANNDVSWTIETSTTLDAASWTPEVSQPGTNNDPDISYTFIPGTPPTKFARLKITQITP